MMLMQFLFAEYSQLSGLCKAFADYDFVQYKLNI